MLNFLKKKMAGSVVILSLLSISGVSHAEDGYQDLNDLDAVINNLIKVSNQMPPAVPASSTEKVYNVTYNTAANNAAGYGTTAPSYSNPFLAGMSAAVSAGAKMVTEDTAPHKMAAYAIRMARNTSAGRCALYVRKALQAAGYNVVPQPSAYMYNNGPMDRIGFKKIPKDGYKPEVGDVIVFNKTPKNPHGHIQIWGGSQWVSDFKQPSMMIYGDNHRGYTIWRDARFIDATMKADRTFLAMNN